MIHLVQIGNGRERRVAMVEEPRLRCLEEVFSVYELARRYAHFGSKMSEQPLRWRAASFSTMAPSMPEGPSGDC
jgi:hypothetical protein